MLVVFVTLAFHINHLYFFPCVLDLFHGAVSERTLGKEDINCLY